MKICFLDDPLRKEYKPASDLFYELIVAALGTDDFSFYFPRRPWRRAGTHGLEKAIVNVLPELSSEEQHAWVRYFHEMPEAVEDILASGLEPYDLIIGYEIPRSLFAALQHCKRPCIDIRLSPYRFGNDLYVAFRVSDAALRSRLGPFVMQRETVQLEADHIAASARYRRRYTKHNLSMDKAVVYVGQTEFDASRVNGNGAFASVQDYGDELLGFCEDRRVLYKAHPYAHDFPQRERAILQELLNREIGACTAGTYETLAADDDLELVGISSGVIQEAEFFRKSAKSFLAPICPISFSATEMTANAYVQVSSGCFLSPHFWGFLLCGDPVSPPPKAMFPAHNSYLRSLHNVWWGYTEHFGASQFLRDAYKMHAHASNRL